MSSAAQIAYDNFVRLLSVELTIHNIRLLFIVYSAFVYTILLDGVSRHQTIKPHDFGNPAS